MTVYILAFIDWCDFEILGVYASMEQAEKAKYELGQKEDGYYRIRLGITAHEVQ